MMLYSSVLLYQNSATVLYAVIKIKLALFVRYQNWIFKLQGNDGSMNVKFECFNYMNSNFENTVPGLPVNGAER